MKTICIIIMTIVFFQSVKAQSIENNLSTDTVKLVVEYYFYNGFINENNYSKRTTAKMFIGKKIYLTDIEIATAKEDSANVISQLSSQGANEDMKKMILRNISPKGIHSIIVKEYNTPEYFFYVNKKDHGIFVNDSASFTWTLTDKTKKIDSFTCQKAIGKFNGDTVIAWFTEQIPLNAGPGKINGLPGLILEYYNPTTKACFRVAKISNTIAKKNEFKEFANTSLIDKSTYNELLKKENEKAEKMRKMLQNGKVENSQL